MKLQIKTLNQKSLLIDIGDTKTVFDLKQELAMYSDVGVRPELQKLIYAGKILSNDVQLSAYNIDVKKFLVVMVLKQPEEGVTTDASALMPAATTSTESPNTPTTLPTTKIEATVNEPSTVSVANTEKNDGGVTTEFRTPPQALPALPTTTMPTRRNSREEMVQNIVSMGYPEGEVRRALEASFFNPERAIEYLIEGLPEAAALGERVGIDYSDYTSNNDVTMAPIEMFRQDPLFRNLRRAIQQHPELIDDAIQRVGEANPAILQLINENQQEFLSMLVDASDRDDDDDDENESS